MEMETIYLICDENNDVVAVESNYILAEKRLFLMNEEEKHRTIECGVNNWSYEAKVFTLVTWSKPCGVCGKLVCVEPEACAWQDAVDDALIHC